MDGAYFGLSNIHLSYCYKHNFNILCSIVSAKIMLTVAINKWQISMPKHYKKCVSHSCHSLMWVFLVNWLLSTHSEISTPSIFLALAFLWIFRVLFSWQVGKRQLEDCRGQSLNAISHNSIIQPHLVVREVRKCILVVCVRGKGTSSLCCRHLSLPHASENADSTPEKMKHVAPALPYSAQGWTYDLS